MAKIIHDSNSFDQILKFSEEFSYAFLIDESKIPLSVCQYKYKEEKVKYLLIDATANISKFSNLHICKLVKKLIIKYNPNYVVFREEYYQIARDVLKLEKLEKVNAQEYGETQYNIFYSWTVHPETRFLRNNYIAGTDLIDVNI